MKMISALYRFPTAYFFLLPVLVFLVIFGIFPFFQVFHLSLYEWDGISKTTHFVGLKQYVRVFQDHVWWISLKNAAWITFLALTLQNGLAFLLAWIVDHDIRLKFFYRLVFYIPPVLSGIVVGIVWSQILDGEYGILNSLLNILNLSHLTRLWFSDPDTAINAVAVVHMWKGFGWGFIIFLAGLRGIPREIYEAAQVEGASSFRIFWSITIPMMIPVLFLVSILTILGTMQIYDIIIATTQGGPGYHTEVPITRIFASLIGSSRFGFSCSMGVVFGFILLIISLLQIWISKKINT